MSGTNWTCRIIRSWSYNSFEMFEIVRNDSKSRTLGAVWVEAERHCILSHANSCISGRNEMVFPIVLWSVMKSGYTMITLSIKAQPCINISGKDEYPLFEASALHLVGSSGCNLLSFSLCSPDVALFNYHLFQLMAHHLAVQHFHSYEDAKNGSTCG